MHTGLEELGITWLPRELRPKGRWRSTMRHFAREVVHCFPACIIVHLLMEVLL